VVRVFHPRYLGLASEINTYADAHPDDFVNFVDLCNQTPAAIMAESPDRRAFVTFQWEDLDNLSIISEGKPAYQIDWDEADACAPQLEVWAISSYPFVRGLRRRRPGPHRLLHPPLEPHGRTRGGGGGRLVVRRHCSLPWFDRRSDRIHVRGRDPAWRPYNVLIYLVLQDFNAGAYRPLLDAQGFGSQVDTLGWFQSVGLQTYDGASKPGVAVWDSIGADLPGTNPGRSPETSTGNPAATPRRLAL